MIVMYERPPLAECSPQFHSGFFEFCRCVLTLNYMIEIFVEPATQGTFHLYAGLEFFRGLTHYCQ